jgi:hypothetical protein
VCARYRHSSRASASRSRQCATLHAVHGVVSAVATGYPPSAPPYMLCMGWSVRWLSAPINLLSQAMAPYAHSIPMLKPLGPTVFARFARSQSLLSTRCHPQRWRVLSIRWFRTHIPSVVSCPSHPPWHSIIHQASLRQWRGMPADPLSPNRTVGLPRSFPLCPPTGRWVCRVLSLPSAPVAFTTHSCQPLL